MQLHNLPVKARRHKKRLGRGNASGRGTYSTRGIKGQLARAGARIRPGFEGGQTPIFSRLPKRRGFHPVSARATAVNIGALESVFPAGTTVTLPLLRKNGLVAHDVRHVKILGDGELTKSLTVKLPTSASAKAKIEKAGGMVIDQPVASGK